MLLVIFFREGRAKDNFKKTDMMQIKSLKGSLEKAMSDSSKVSNELLTSFDEKICALNEVLEKIDAKQKRLGKYIVQAEELLKEIDEKKQQHSHEILDPYKMAAELISRGLSPEDVQRDSGLSLSEIDLIKQLIRHKSN
jgi:hypothetical protein